MCISLIDEINKLSNSKYNLEAELEYKYIDL